jgi:radical SAM superfamily enzyme YgiQ (UPF0313 family)
MKIGLIAMSGVGSCDEELLSLGLTLPGFVERSRVIASLPSLGLLTIAGMIPKRHEVDYVEIPDINEVDSLPGEWDMVAISSYSYQINEAYELAKRYKNAGIPVVMGGLHVSYLPGEAKEFCDSVIIGEGEVGWPEFLSDLEEGEIKPIYGSVDDEFDLNDAPMPAFELLDMKKYDRLTVQTSRGCPHKCEFCATSPLISKRYKQKPINKVLDEIDKILSMWDGHFIEFVDDNAIINKEYWKELLNKLKNRKIRWFVETDVSVAEDEDLLKLMRDSGCAQVLIGLESPIKAGLDNIEIKSNWKLKQFHNYREVVNKIQSHGIRVTGCFVLGLDEHGPDIFDRVYDFAVETEMFDIQITLQTPFPGTPLYDRLKNEDRLLEEKNWRKCTLFDVNYIPKNMSAEELRKGFRDLGVRIYSEELTKWRREKFKEYLKKVLKEERKGDKTN